MEEAFKTIVKAALAEDIGTGDITSAATLPAGLSGRFFLKTRQKIVLAGIEAAEYAFSEVSADISFTPRAKDGDALAPGALIAEISGPAAAILTAERTALNLLQRMSGVATLTRLYVEAVSGTKAVILDTRKTIPGLRVLDKYAVRMGGGQNHRMRLDDGVLIKDNHIAANNGDIAATIARAKAHLQGRLPITVECDTLAQAEEALKAGADRLLLDNMPPATLKKAAALVAGRVPLEASGGVTLTNVREIAETGVDYIAIGALTHSAPAVDIGLDD